MNTAEVYCQATVNYAEASGGVPLEVSIHNGRDADLHWQDNGFEMLQHHSAVTDWTDTSQLQQCYYGEMEALAIQLTGARSAMISGHIARNPAQAQEHADYAPIQFVHSDFTDNYGDLLKQRYAAGGEFETAALANAGLQLDEFLNAKDIMILQFWRNVGEPVVDLPLAFCDAATAPREDVHAIHVPNYAGGDFAFDAFAVSQPGPGRQHDWYVFPELNVDEVVALRTFDSRMLDTDKPYWTPHTAFKDPLHPKAAARCSIEVRATCLF